MNLVRLHINEHDVSSPRLQLEYQVGIVDKYENKCDRKTLKVPDLFLF